MLNRIKCAIFPSHQEETAKLESRKLKELVRGIVTARPHEIACDECFENLNCFADTTLAGKDTTATMPLVQDHLNRCHDCREEFQALLAALQAIS